MTSVIIGCYGLAAGVELAKKEVYCSHVNPLKLCQAACLFFMLKCFCQELLSPLLHVCALLFHVLDDEGIAESGM